MHVNVVINVVQYRNSAGYDAARLYGVMKELTYVRRAEQQALLQWRQVKQTSGRRHNERRGGEAEQRRKGGRHIEREHFLVVEAIS